MGVHRAASTAIQNYLDWSRSGLLKYDVSLLVPADSRGQVYKGHFTKLKNLSALSPRKLYLEKRLSGLLNKIATDMVIISEENLIGTMPGQDTPFGFYPRSPRFFQTLDRWSAQYEIHPRLIVRSQDKWIQSLYAFRVFRGLKASFGEFVKSIPKGLLDWNRIWSALNANGLDKNSHAVWLDDVKGQGFHEWLPEFLDIPSAALGPQKIPTNESMLLRDLALFWALNQIGWGYGDKKARRALRASFVKLSHIHGDRLLARGEVADYLRGAGLDLSASDFKRAEEAYHAMPNPKYTEAGRKAFMETYSPLNEQFRRVSQKSPG